MDSKPIIELAEPKAQAPAELTAPCFAPIELPAGAMSAGAVERGWGADRAALADCASRKDAETEFYTRRDTALASEKGAQ